MRIFGVQATIMFVGGTLALAILNPMNYHRIPDFILMMTVLLFFGYILSVSVIDMVRNLSSMDLRSFFRKKAFERYINFFLGMFIISTGLTVFNFSFLESTFFMVVLFVVIEFVRTISPEAKEGYLNYRILIVAPVLYFVFFNEYDTLFFVVRQSIFACGLLFIFSFVKCFNTYACPLGELKAGMMPAETVVKENGRYVKSNVPYISFPLYFRKKVVNKVFRKDEVVTPFKALRTETIELLRKKTEFDMLMIQMVIDIRVFLVLGVVGAYFIV